MSNLAKVSDLLLQVAEDIVNRKEDRIDPKEISNLCKVSITLSTIEGTESRQMSVGDPTKGSGTTSRRKKRG